MDISEKNISKIIDNISADRLSSYKYDNIDNINLILDRYIYNVQNF